MRTTVGPVGVAVTGGTQAVIVLAVFCACADIRFGV